jgi:hypothetical protein
MGEWFVGVLIKKVLDWLRSYFEELFGIFRRDKANQAQSAAQAAQDTKKAEELKPASTPEEVSAAIDDELSHF